MSQIFLIWILPLICKNRKGWNSKSSMGRNQTATQSEVWTGRETVCKEQGSQGWRELVCIGYGKQGDLFRYARKIWVYWFMLVFISEAFLMLLKMTWILKIWVYYDLGYNWLERKSLTYWLYIYFYCYIALHVFVYL